MKRERLIKTALISGALATLGLGWAWFQGCRLNMTPSAPRGLYRQLNAAPQTGRLGLILSGVNRL